MKKNKRNYVKRLLSLVLSMVLILTSLVSPVQAEELADTVPVVSIAEEEGGVATGGSDISIVEDGSDVVMQEEGFSDDNAEEDMVPELLDEESTVISEADVSSDAESGLFTDETAGEESAEMFGEEEEASESSDALNLDEGFVIEDIEMEADPGLVLGDGEEEPVPELTGTGTAQDPYVITDAAQLPTGIEAGT